MTTVIKVIIQKAKTEINRHSLVSSSCNRETAQINLQKDMISTQKQPSCKKWCGPMHKGQCEKSCEIKGGGQEMAVMV